MKRIWITGTTCSGKTTLANLLGNRYGIPVYHRDAITWGKNWYERSACEQIEIIKDFTTNDCWIFEGNMFTMSKEDGRLDRCDTIIHLKVNRILCVYRGITRYLKYRNNPRPELSEGCKEKYSLNVVIKKLFGKSKKTKDDIFRLEAKRFGKNVIILNGLNEINIFYRQHGLELIRK